MYQKVTENITPLIWSSLQLLDQGLCVGPGAGMEVGLGLGSVKEELRKRENQP